MARTTITTVKAILDTNLSDLVIQSHIDIASRMIDSNMTNSGLSTAVLKDIETYLTAHLIAIGKERQAMDEQIGDVRVTYQGKFGESLKMTTYGQMVSMLDTTGKMDQIGAKNVRIRAIRQVDP